MRRVFWAIVEEEMSEDSEFGPNAVVPGIRAVAARRDRSTSRTNGA